MTREEFAALPQQYQSSGKSLKAYLGEIGEKVTRIVKHQPGKLYVKEIVRPKYGLMDNTMLPPEGQPSVVVAPMPLLSIYKGIADATLLSEILLQKYEYHMPFYRQIKQFTHLGMKGLKENTIDGWFKKTMELLRPLYLALVEEVMERLVLFHYDEGSRAGAVIESLAN